MNSLLNGVAVLVFTLGDSLFGCLQVRNLLHGRRLPALVTSLAISLCKLLGVVFVVKDTTPFSVVGYVAGGAIGAQISLMFDWRTNERP